MPDQNQRTKRIVKERTGNSSHFDAGKSLRKQPGMVPPAVRRRSCQKVSKIVAGREGAASCSSGFWQAQRLVWGVSLISSSLLPSLRPLQSAPLGDLGFLQEWQSELRFEEGDYKRWLE